MRRHIVETYGNKTLLEEGLTVWTTLDLEREHHAEESLINGVRTVDKRQGYLGPIAQISDEAKQKKMLELVDKKILRGQDKLEEGYPIMALVTDVKRMSEWSPQVWRSFVAGGPVRLGTRFVNINHDGWKHWPTSAKVVRFEPHAEFAFRISEKTWTVSPGSYRSRSVSRLAMRLASCASAKSKTRPGADARCTRSLTNAPESDSSGTVSAISK